VVALPNTPVVAGPSVLSVVMSETVVALPVKAVVVPSVSERVVALPVKAAVVVAAVVSPVVPPALVVVVTTSVVVATIVVSAVLLNKLSRAGAQASTSRSQGEASRIASSQADKGCTILL